MSEPVRVFQTASFARANKRLHTAQRREVDGAVAAIVADPLAGEPKKGDLQGVYVYKFRANRQLMLLAYEFDPATRMLLLLGSHENFYQELKR